MLSDPFNVPWLSAGGIEAMNPGALDFLSGTITGSDIVPLHLIPSSLTGGSKRKGEASDGTKVTLTVSHSQSNENKPYVTDRSLIRLDYSRVDSVTGKPVICSVYVVVALPQGSTFSSTDAKRFAEAMGVVLIQGGWDPSHGAPRNSDTVDGVTLGRIITGEA